METLNYQMDSATTEPFQRIMMRSTINLMKKIIKLAVSWQRCQVNDKLSQLKKKKAYKQDEADMHLTQQRMMGMKLDSTWFLIGALMDFSLFYFYGIIMEDT